MKSVMSIDAARAVFTAIQTLGDNARLPVPAEAPQCMHVLAQATDLFRNFGRTLPRRCWDRMETASTRAIGSTYDHMADLITALPKHANAMGEDFLAASKTFHDLDKIGCRPASSPRPVITIEAVTAVQTAVSGLVTPVRLPVPADGSTAMTLLADAMLQLSQLGSKLGRACWSGAEQAATPAIGDEYEALARTFTELRRHAQSARAVFLDMVDASELLNRNIARSVA